MNATFKFADWNPVSETVPAYFVDRHSGLITVGRIAIGADGEPTDASGFALDDDVKTERLLGWGHSVCASYNGGQVLVPLKGSRT